MSMLSAFDPYRLFQRSAELHAARPALSIGGQEWTYAELDGYSSAIAGWCDRNTPDHARIAVHGRKELLAYAAILGILRSGRSYVPLHPDHPPARWRAVMDRSGATALIADATVAGLDQVFSGPVLYEVPEGKKSGSVDGAEAYVMFTSGSTGGPKGVPVSRANVAAYLEHMVGAYAFSPLDRFTQLFALTFDLSVHDLFVCWGTGGCLCAPLEDGALRIASYIKESRITSWFSVPSQVALLRKMRVLGPSVFPGLKHTFFCGEALSWELGDTWLQAAPNSAVINLYGPTEATIAITSHDLRSTDARGVGTVPLGRPIGAHRARLADVNDEGEGELLFSGPQITAGYLNDPVATQRAFVHLPDDLALWYRTGDRGRVDPDGVIHFLGRLDDQVKVLGHRVEPAEVDAVLAGHLPGAAVLTLGVELNGTARLVTFIDTAVDVPALLAILKNELPPYMVPDRILVVDRFPTTAHGKIDRKALLNIALHG